MRSERPTPAANLSDALVALVAPVNGQANRRVAGMAVGARIAAEAQKAGASELWIVSEGPPSISEQTWEDMNRASPGLEILTLSAAEAQARLERQRGRPLLLLSATHLVPASLYPKLLADTYLAASGKIVAATAIAGEPLPILGRPVAGDCPEIIELGDRAKATWAIVRGTAKPSDGVVSRHLNRPISQRMSATLLQWEWVRPWHLTLATALLTLIMFAALVFGGAQGLVAGGLLFHCASVLDGVDGEIARATYRSSVRGAVLDTAVDAAGNLLFMLGLTLDLTWLRGAHYAHLGAWAVAAGATGLVALSALTLRIGEYGNFNILKDFYSARYETGFPAQVRIFITRVTSRDFFAFGCAVLTLTGQPQLALWGFTGFTTLWVLLILAAAPGILRQGAVLPARGSPATT